MTKPCKECPYRKDSAPGYLGETSWNPERFLQQETHPCHLTVDWENEDYSQAKPCAGNLQFLKNTCKLPNDREACKSLKLLTVDTSEVFGRRQEFITHHSKT